MGVRVPRAAQARVRVRGHGSDAAARVGARPPARGAAVLPVAEGVVFVRVAVRILAASVVEGVAVVRPRAERLRGGGRRRRGAAGVGAVTCYMHREHRVFDGVVYGVGRGAADGAWLPCHHTDAVNAAWRREVRAFLSGKSAFRGGYLRNLAQVEARAAERATSAAAGALAAAAPRAGQTFDRCDRGVAGCGEGRAHAHPDVGGGATPCVCCGGSGRVPLPRPPAPVDSGTRELKK